VRRGMIAEDGFDKLAEVNLKAPIEIIFIDQFGQEEWVSFSSQFGYGSQLCLQGGYRRWRRFQRIFHFAL
jgi:hypothetical protein